jgi:cytochrome c556
MSMRTAVLVLAMGATLAGCGKKQDDATPANAAPEATAATATEQPAAPAVGSEAMPAPAVTAFDINAIPVSTATLPAWPYVVLPAGYQFNYADDLASRTKDLARVPVWTGGQLLWVEGKVFSDRIDNQDGKTYSRFEVRKNVQQAIEALGGVRLTERTFDEATYKANEKALDDVRQEFDRMQSAYWYDEDADTYVIRRADKAIWVVFQSSNDRGALLVAEGPLPEAPAKS